MLACGIAPFLSSMVLFFFAFVIKCPCALIAHGGCFCFFGGIAPCLGLVLYAVFVIELSALCFFGALV